MRALTAAALDKVTYRFADATAPADSDSTAATATCDAGQRVIGGGVRLDDPTDRPDRRQLSQPLEQHGMDRACRERPVAAQNFTVYAICTSAATVG